MSEDNINKLSVPVSPVLRNKSNQVSAIKQSIKTSSSYFESGRER